MTSLSIPGLAAAALLASTTALAQQQDISASELEELLRVKTRSIQHMALNPVVVQAVKRQNGDGLSLDEIKRRDEKWSASDRMTPFKTELQTSAAGRFLEQQIGRTEHFNEAFATDNQGANVAAFPATSDYWQGDEDKWSQSYKNGAGEVYLGPLEYDDSSRAYAVQVSAPVLDRGRTIGVLVVGVTLKYLERKQQ